MTMSRQALDVPEGRLPRLRLCSNARSYRRDTGHRSSCKLRN
ncbi:hypothetical protein LAZ67_1008183 [Cordylochernes scorpioides]|uniref:Uncharacterized protein n=1 Tax=Cordylochernes scorpioides TaxID=51811 RepID=A0ABY6K033_9ARAC|nr:hypothetical protein LAZ67_1008183 [Cordylochernes scorpioides]